MKKLFILFVSFIFLCLPAFAEYKPMPAIFLFEMAFFEGKATS